MFGEISPRLFVLSGELPAPITFLNSTMSSYIIDDAEDILNWLDELQLFKRKAKLTQNIPAAAADGVIVAEIIHAVYPKIIQVQ